MFNDDSYTWWNMVLCLCLQLQMVVDAMQNMLFLVMDAENALEIPNKYKATCYHNKPQTECLSTTHNLFPCPTTDDLCYRMTRVIVEFVDISLVESGSAVSLRVWTCWALISSQIHVN